MPKFIVGNKKKVTHLTVGQKIKCIFQDLGPTYIKFGQTLSCHPDLLPRNVIHELEKLQDKVEPFSFSQVGKIVKKTFKKPLSEVFTNFSQEPLASASIAQVHLAELSTGEKVAVKIQRPNLEKNIRKDIELLHLLALLAEKNIPELKRYELVHLVSEFEKSIEKEIDFRLEADNFDHFRRNFSDILEIYFPKVYREYSNRYVLTLEYIYGAKIDSILKEDSTHNRNLVAERGIAAVYKQIFEDGFFHADPHKGNLIIMKDDVVCFIDAGMVGFLNTEVKDFLTNLLIAISDRNINSIISLFINEGMVPDDCKTDNFKEDLDDIFNRYYGTDLQNVNISEILNKFITLVYHYQIRLPSSMLLVIRCLIILEGVGNQIDPQFNPTANMIPYAQKMLSKQFQPAKIISDLNQFLKENLWVMKSFPNDLLLLLQKIIKGKYEIKLDHEGLEDLNQTINKASSRLTSGILATGAIVASSLIIRSNLPPLISGFSIFGILGYIISFIIIISIFLTIRKDIK
ncbi:AarF/ABC1/UbiB kinase family protein [Candidatus Beckwithbacteria bacterium]|nr:AarF/ABC1/UbiB kinase family protein [Candidatus Beckwithbacteria bacterium]